MRNTILEALSDNIVIDQDKCIYCGECVETCILDNLRMKLAPCRQACPLGVNCQGYVQMILRGQDAEALEMVERKLPFPGILGRVCSAQCETGCHRGQVGDAPVAIRALKRFVDSKRPAGLPVPESAPASGKSCAVVGSGPAGMMAAWELMQKGHAVTIYDADTQPGGMLRWAIPEFRLPSQVLDQEFTRLQAMGLKYQGGQALGKELSLDSLSEKHDAVILAMGCPQSKRLGIEGEVSQGVLHALPLLRAVREGQTPQVGAKVVVIGGGDVAVDCAQTALRLGAAQVTMVSLESGSEMPASQEALAMAQAEGVVLEGSWGPTKILHAGGRAVGLELQRCLAVFDNFGRFAPTFDECALNEIEADTIIVAIGQERDIQALGGDLPGCDELTLQTEQENVFMAGDLHKGPSTIVEAMASGREAAESVHRLFTNQHLGYGRAYPGPIETQFDIDTERGSDAKRTAPPMAYFLRQIRFQ